MEIFKRTKNIDINLGNLTIREIMNFPKKDDAGLEEFYINEVFNSNHVQIGVVQGRVYTSGIHDFEYDSKTNKIKIFSRFRNSAFLIYGYLIMPLIPLILNKNQDGTMELIIIIISFFIFFSLILIMGIKSESKEIEREMVIRLNYLRRNKNR